ncbi:MAG: acetate--CoA ligase family protein [Alphaproteobacteria bacterium]|nr:acetate--CoA ligase family protein [Alphaproteobacteria bacterium]
MDIVGRAMRARQHALSEWDSKRLLAAYGIPVARERLAASPDDAVAAAEALGMPVAIKACHWTLQHKTELDLVRLGLGDAASVRAAAGEIAARLPEGGGLLVQEMVGGRRELLLGLTRDPQFGACVSIGIGGIFAELLQDVAFRIVPFDRLEAACMLDELRYGAILGGFRGMPEVERGPLEDALLALCRLAQELPMVREIDINPMIVAGGRSVAVDALVILETE